MHSYLWGGHIVDILKTKRKEPSPGMQTFKKLEERVIFLGFIKDWWWSSTTLTLFVSSTRSNSTFPGIRYIHIILVLPENNSSIISTPIQSIFWNDSSNLYIKTLDTWASYKSRNQVHSSKATKSKPHLKVRIGFSHAEMVIASGTCTSLAY